MNLCRNTWSEESEVLGVVFNVVCPLLCRSGQCFLDILNWGVEAVEVEVFSLSGVSNNGLVCANVAFDAVDDPLQNARVVAEARPQEASIFATGTAPA